MLCGMGLGELMYGKMRLGELLGGLRPGEIMYGNMMSVNSCWVGMR